MKLLLQPLPFLQAQSAHRSLLLHFRVLATKPLREPQLISPRFASIKIESRLKSMHHSEAKIKVLLESITAKYQKAEIVCAAAEAEIQAVDAIIVQCQAIPRIGQTKDNRSGSGMPDAKAMLHAITVKYLLHKRLRAAAEVHAKELAYVMSQAAVIENGYSHRDACPTLDCLNVTYAAVRSNYASVAEAAMELARIMPLAEAMYPARNQELFHGDITDADSMLRYLVVKYRAVNLKCSEAESSVMDFDEAISQAETSIGESSFSKKWIAMHDAFKSMRSAALGAQALVDQMAEAQDCDTEDDFDEVVNILIRLVMRFREAESMRSRAVVDGKHVYLALQKLIASNPFYPCAKGKHTFSATPSEDQDGDSDHDDHVVDNSVVDANLLLTSLIEHISPYNIDDDL
jgi:hypothetical protein